MLTKLLEQRQEDTLIQWIFTRILDLELSQLVPPGLLHGTKEPNVQRLHLVSGIGREANKLDVIFPAQVDDIHTDVC